MAQYIGSGNVSPQRVPTPHVNCASASNPGVVAISSNGACYEAGEVNQAEEQGHNDERENEDDVWGPQPCKVKLARTSQSKAPITLEPQEDDEEAELAGREDQG